MWAETESERSPSRFLLENLTTCSQCIKLTLVVPKECRMDADMLAGRLKQMFDRELFKDLCRGCPLENPQE